MGKIKEKYLFLALALSLAGKNLPAQDSVDLNLNSEEEVNVNESLKSTDPMPADSAVPTETTTEAPPAGPEEKTGDAQTAKKEETQDDLQSLKEDIGDMAEGPQSAEGTEGKEKSEALKASTEVPEEEKKGALNIVPPPVPGVEKKEGNAPEKVEIIADKLSNFDTGDEEKKLLALSKSVQAKITPKEWDDLAIKAKLQKYEVQKGDYLWKISKQLFGSGFYYSKIWSLNPQITNPHEIEPGTVLAFDSGDADNFPTVQVGEFSDDEMENGKGGSGSYTQMGGPNKSPWIAERKKLIDQGVYFQFASEETYDDLEQLAKMQHSNEYQKYEPPLPDVVIAEPSDNYDSAGFDKSDKISYKFREGFFLNTFVTTNVVQDVGWIKATSKGSVFIHKNDTVFAFFDKSTKVKPGDMFTVYSSGGEIKHPVSDRAGFQYSTTAQLKVMRKKDDLWECLVVDQSGIVQRNDHITVYTPRIARVSRTFSRRSIESAIIGGFRESLAGMSYGDVIYIDRGRADGVELGNIFDVYSFVDPGTQKKITASPSYKIGELTVINLTENFATALVTASSSEIGLGSLAVTRTQEEQARMMRLKNKDKLNDVKKLEGKALEELDVELNLDDVSQDILNKADKIQLTEDELEELERKERDKSIIKDSERDVKELDRLESEIADAESSLNESKVDEDKFLEQQSLEDLEKKSKQQDPNAFESLNEIEKDLGKKYLDEDINNKENPYGLTEFDLEEVDELLNTDFQK